jgi:hypothetical protein
MSSPHQQSEQAAAKPTTIRDIPMDMLCSDPSFDDYPGTLARLGSASSDLWSHFRPRLREIKRHTKFGKYDLILETFPTIRNLPMPETQANGVAYYDELLGMYLHSSPNVQPVETSYSIGLLFNQREHTAEHTNDADIVVNLTNEMRSAQGRRNVINAINDWRKVADGFSSREVKRARHVLLDRLETLMRTDFGVVAAGKRIGSVHEGYLPAY